MTLYGRTIDAYHIGRLLGRGSFGDVYEAKCQHSGQLVAIKMISKELLQNQGLLDRITREVEIHCQLQHPHIVELYEYFEDDRRVYLVMELCKNGELLALLRQHGCFDAGTARTYFGQLVTGVAYLHSHSILHRDLKLSNLLLSSDNTLKIADFGLAAAIGADDPERRTICGTPNYMCPEIVEQQPYSLSADLWSLGVTLYTLLTGTPPFQSDAVRGTLQRVGCTDYLLPPELPAEAADLIKQLLQKNPARRLSLSAIQTHPFLVGRPKPQEPCSESRGASERSLNSHRSANSTSSLPQPSTADGGVVRGGQSRPTYREYEQEGVRETWSERKPDQARRGSSLETAALERGVEKIPRSDRREAPQNGNLGQSHKREFESGGRSGAAGRREHADASLERGHVTTAYERGLARPSGVRHEERSSSGGFGEGRSGSERSWSREAAAQPRSAPASQRPDGRRPSGQQDSHVRPQSSSSRPGSARSDRDHFLPSLKADPQFGVLPPPSPARLPTRPLSTLRLKALQHETSYGSLAILEDGRVQVRHTGPGESVFTVSGDGLEVEVEQAGRPRKGYRFPALPDGLLMHYAHAAAFVGIVASATPKVVYIFERGQATSMENGDLQVCFTDCSPATLLQVEAALGKVTVTPPNGPPLTLPSLHSRPSDFQSTDSTPGPNDTWLWEALSQARRCQRKCAEAEARAVARNPPKTFPLVARSARLKSLLQRGGADATVALASAAPPAEVERAAELVAAVQSLHTSLLPADVSIASAQELSFASSSSSSSHLQTGPGYVPQQQYLHVPVLKPVFQKRGARSPSSPLSPDPSLHSLPETPAARGGSSLGHVAERQPFSVRAAADERPSASENVAERWPLKEEPKDLLGRQEGLEMAAEMRERERGVAFHSRGEEDHLRHVAADERRGVGAAEPPGSRSDGYQASLVPQRVKKPPRPNYEEPDKPKELVGFRDSVKEDERAWPSGRRAESGDVMGRGGGRQAEGPGRVLADVSNRQPLEVQNIRRAEKAKGGDAEGRTRGGLDGVRRRTSRLESTDKNCLESRSAESEKERRPADRQVEGFKVFDDRAELDAHAAAMRARLREGRHANSQRGGSDVAGESRQADHSASDDPSLERNIGQHQTERLQRQELPPFRDARKLSDPASARSYSDTWQDLSGQNREPLSRPSASPSSNLWQDVRPRNRLLEESAVCPDPSGTLEKQYPSREDARSYVASNHPANRRPPSNPLGPMSLNSSQSSYASLLPTSQPSSLNTGEFDDPSIGGASETQTGSKPPSHPNPNGAASLDAERSNGRPEMGADSEKGRQSAYFPGVGWAIRLKSGELLMHYLDDCQMVVSNDGATVEFWPPGTKMGGSKHNLSDRRSIPQEVRDKLQHLSAFIKLIRKQSHGGQEYSKWVTPKTSPSLSGR